MIDRREISRSGYLAGQVERYHTWPTLRRQSNAEHTWQVMRIWYTLFGSMSPDVSTYAIWHDAGEQTTGDLPWPMKSQDPELRRKIHDMEHTAIRGMGGQLPELDETERHMFKLCEYLEMAEFGLQEAMMGNQFAMPIAASMMKEARHRAEQDGVRNDRVTEYLGSVNRRLKRLLGVYP